MALRRNNTDEIIVVNAGRGMPAALATKLMKESGARVVAVSAANDPFFTIYPAFAAWHSGMEWIAPGELETALAIADVCIIGGEDHPDAVSLLHDGADLPARYPQLVIARMTGFGAAAPDLPAVDLLVQARSGMVWEHRPDRPIALGCLLPTYGSVLLTVLGIWTALVERLDSGLGQLVQSSMFQGGAMFWGPYWMIPHTPTPEIMKFQPRGARHLTFQCADGGYVQLAPGAAGSLAKLYAVLEIPVAVDPAARGTPDVRGGLANYFGDTALLEKHIARFQRDDLLRRLWAQGFAADAVLKPGECWDEPQAQSGLYLQSDAEGTRYVGPLIRMTIRPDSEGEGDNDPGAQCAGVGPLSGVRIVDFGAVVAGPYASALLADLGADVIKVEPLAGDFTRERLRTTIIANHGKRSIALDAKDESDARTIQSLCRSANIVHHNFRVGVAERLKLDRQSLRDGNPKLVTLHSSAYGEVGPKATFPGLDMVIQAYCGHEHRSGGEGNPPLCGRSFFVDYVAAGAGAIAMVRGLFEQRSRGRGGDFGTSLLEAGLFLVAELIQTDGRFKGAPPLDHEQAGFDPHERIYETSDGWIAIAARGAAMQTRLLNFLREIDGALTAPLSSAAVAACFASLRTHELLDRLHAADIWSVACAEDGWRDLAEAAAQQGQPMLREIAVPGECVVTGWFGPLFHMSRSELEYSRGASPALNEHGTQIRMELA
ncbi:CoA transferase [Sphingomonas sp. MG17]|uniref:CoA transferase n=1 Tax=Sphingomonas tagetis TaxID=2949092 RepID=A0A9X2KNW5_9SPHN|nr:CoA transferase [Sphingomonas tagetis]MCP3730048.1 CoA transferase [Sphingomonas tagetis]